MLELYNNTNSVCAQKVRLALTEKGLQAGEHMLKLQGNQFDPAYLKLNPKRRGADTRPRRTTNHRVGGHSLLPGRRLPATAADAGGSGRSGAGAHVQQADR
jgi:hypothetical protein